MSLEIAFQNNRLRIVAGAAQTGGAFTVIDYIAGAGFVMPIAHIHEDVDELCYVLEGELTLIVGDETIDAGPGQMVWKPHGIPHSFLVKGPSPVRFIEVSTPAGIERYFEEAAALMSGGQTPDPAALIALMGRHRMKPASKGKS
jgi:mannose-6-phosphate isomerase-like protein (cupin superfamily)